MRTDGVIYADDVLLPQVLADKAPEQVANVAFLPGIQKCALAMPDIHWGYGFPIGGVAATDPAEGGVVSPGGVGYDINCGVRLMRTRLSPDDIAGRVEDLVAALFRDVPCGLGRSGAHSFSRKEQTEILEEGSGWIVRRGFGRPEDLDYTESRGCLPGAKPSAVSDRAMERGRGQVGTLGAGNHFLEIQVVDEVYDAEAAQAFGLAKGAVTVMMHSGSRGLGYEICDNSLRTLHNAPRKYGIELPDRQVGVRAGSFARGGALPGGHAVRRQLRMGQPADAHASGAPGDAAVLRHVRGPARHGVGL